MSDPLYAKVGEGDWHLLNVYFNGHLSDDAWTEIDVLGCWGVRYAKDRDGNPIILNDVAQTEKVYGHFRLEKIDVTHTSQIEHGSPFVTNIERVVQQARRDIAGDRADTKLKFKKRKKP